MPEPSPRRPTRPSTVAIKLIVGASVVIIALLVAARDDRCDDDQSRFDCPTDDRCHRGNGAALLRVRVHRRRTERRRKEARRHHLPPLRLRGNLLVRVRAGSDVAQPFRARLHGSHGVRLGDAYSLAAIGKLGLCDCARACLRNGLDRARQARQGSVERRQVRVGTCSSPASDSS